MTCDFQAQRMPIWATKILMCWGVALGMSHALAAEPATLAAPLSLESAVERAVGQAIKVDQAQAEVDAQTEAKRGAWTNVGPHARVQYLEARYPEALYADPPQNSKLLRDEVTKNASLELSQTVSGLWAAVEYSRLKGKQADLAFEGLRLAKRDAAFSAAEAYLNAYRTEAQDLIASSSIEAVKHQYQDALALQRVGRQSQGDVLKFQLALSLAESSAAKARAAKKIALVVLKQLIRWPEEDSLTLQKDLPSLVSEPRDVKQSIELAMDQRPEVKQAELGVEIAGYGREIAYAQYVPDISIFKKWDRNLGELSAMSPAKDSSAIGIRLQWDIWSNGSSLFAVREAIAKKNQAEAMKEGAHDGVRLDVIQAWENFEAAKQSLILAKTAVVQAEEAYRIDQTRFRNGQISATELIRSENDRRAAQGQKVAAETDTLLWHFRLQRSTGKEVLLGKAAS